MDEREAHEGPAIVIWARPGCWARKEGLSQRDRPDSGQGCEATAQRRGFGGEGTEVLARDGVEAQGCKGSVDTPFRLSLRCSFMRGAPNMKPVGFSRLPVLVVPMVSTVGALEPEGDEDSAGRARREEDAGRVRRPTIVARVLVLALGRVGLGYEPRCNVRGELRQTGI